jgi:hypothetical protein
MHIRLFAIFMMRTTQTALFRATNLFCLFLEILFSNVSTIAQWRN